MHEALRRSSAQPLDILHVERRAADHSANMGSKGMQRYAIADWNENSPCSTKDFGETLVNKIDQAKPMRLSSNVSGKETTHNRLPFFYRL
jgi:hypothetical protein